MNILISNSKLKLQTVLSGLPSKYYLEERPVTPTKYARLVRNMGERPELESDEIEYAAEIVTGGEPGVPDTVVLVTDAEVVAGAIDGKEAESQLDFAVRLDDIREIECDGMFTREIPLETTTGHYTIPTEGLDPSKFTSAIVGNTKLTNTCERFGFGRTRFAICKWSTCLGAALIIVGIGFSVTMIGILVGLPFIGLGAALLVFALAYKKAGDYLDDSVWRLPEAGAGAA